MPVISPSIRRLLVVLLLGFLAVHFLSQRYLCPPSHTPAPPSSISSDNASYTSLHPDLPESRYVNGVAGFNYFENIYLYQGAYLFVTSNPDQLPSQGSGFIMSGWKEGKTGRAAIIPARPDRWQVIDPEEAKERLGTLAVRKRGVSMFFNDEAGPGTPAFLGHYFHFIGEMFLGGWRVVAAAGVRELPARIMYRAKPTGWRDHAGINAWFQQHVLPDTAIEEATIFADRDRSSTPYLFDKIAILDRWAAHRHGKRVRAWNKAAAELDKLEVPVDWMMPLRDSVKQMAVTAGCQVQRQHPDVPVVVYINRQRTRRRLYEEDAEVLASALSDLHDQGLIELHDVQMEMLSQIEQFCLSLRADIMLGVHGNGLSHQLWMKPGSGVLEIMREGGFARDYGLIADLMGHEYYTVHLDHFFPRELWNRARQGRKFHSADIRVDGEWVAERVKEMAEARVGVRETS